jgi:hypothetical protein
MLADPGELMTSIPARSLAGVHAWQIYAASEGDTVEGVDAHGTRIVAFLVPMQHDSSSAQVTERAVWEAPGVDDSPQAVVDALHADVSSAQSSSMAVRTPTLRPQDEGPGEGTALTEGCTPLVGTATNGAGPSWQPAPPVATPIPQGTLSLQEWRYRLALLNACNPFF